MDRLAVVSAEQRVLILAPTGRDGALAAQVLEGSDLGALACADVHCLRREIESGAGAILVTEETLTPNTIASLAEIFRSQPAWSDLPLLVVSVGAGDAERVASAIRQLSEHADITLIDRPTRKVTLVSAVQAALRARGRQYEVRDLLEQLERSVRERDQFLAMLGHELRNPLGAMLTAIELMERGSQGSPPRELSVLDRQARILSRLVDDLLDVSRLTLGKIDLTRFPVDIGELATRCVQTMLPTAAAGGIRLSLDVCDGGFTTIGDSVRLEQVVNNLLTNAIKYTPRGGSVEVRISASDDAGGEIRVKDSGVGIDAAILPRVFEPFTQASSTIDRSEGGLGIGLTLVRHIVALHGGTVEAQSSGRGAGSAFVVRLPRTARRVEPPARPLAVEMLPPRRILVIEDNTDLREGLKRLLENVGHEVFESADGEDGVVKALARRPDVILVDIGLPKLDGYKVAARLRPALSDGVLLVAVSGYGSKADRTRAFEAGFDYHLTKPITLQSILNVLNRAAPRFAPPRPSAIQ